MLTEWNSIRFQMLCDQSLLLSKREVRIRKFHRRNLDLGRHGGILLLSSNRFIQFCAYLLIGSCILCNVVKNLLRCFIEKPYWFSLVVDFGQSFQYGCGIRRMGASKFSAYCCLSQLSSFLQNFPNILQVTTIYSVEMPTGNYLDAYGCIINIKYVERSTFTRYLEFTPRQSNNLVPNVSGWLPWFVKFFTGS